MLYFGWSSLFLSFPSPPILVPIHYWLYEEHQLQLVSPSLQCFFYNPSVTVLRARIIIGINDTFMFYSFFQSPRKVDVLVFNFFQFYSVLSRSIKVHNFESSPLLLFFLSSVRWKRLGDTFVCQNPRGILPDWCWVVHIPFVRMVEFKFLAQFPMDHLTHSVVSCLILFLS